MLPDDFFKQFSESLKQAANAAKVFLDVQQQYAQQFQQIAETAARAFEAIPKQVFDFAQTLKNLDKAGLTPNLGKNASIHKLKDYQKLLKCGYPIFWVPRAEVIDTLLAAKTETQRKTAVKSNRARILEDCREAVANVTHKSLKDTRLHLQAAIAAMEQGNDRSAQSTASVCIDAQLDQIIDTTALSSFREINKQVYSDSKKLKTFNEVPVYALYAALQAQLIVFVLRDFDRLKPNTVRTKYSRHSSIHSVSSRQYSEFNALQAIMIATTMLATSDRLGKGWLSNLAKLV
jgi:hypothetical protein